MIFFDNTSLFFDDENTFFDDTQRYDSVLSVTGVVSVSSEGAKQPNALFDVQGITSVGSFVVASIRSGVVDITAESGLAANGSKSAFSELITSGISDAAINLFSKQTNSTLSITSTSSLQFVAFKTASGVADNIVVSPKVVTVTSIRKSGVLPPTIATASLSASGNKNSNSLLSITGDTSLIVTDTSKQSFQDFILTGETTTNLIGSKTSVSFAPPLLFTGGVDVLSGKKVIGNFSLTARGIVTTFFSRYIKEFQVDIVNDTYIVDISTFNTQADLEQIQKLVSILSLSEQVGINTFQRSPNINTQSYTINIETK